MRNVIILTGAPLTSSLDDDDLRPSTSQATVLEQSTIASREGDAFHSEVTGDFSSSTHLPELNEVHLASSSTPPILQKWTPERLSQLYEESLVVHAAPTSQLCPPSTGDDGLQDNDADLSSTRFQDTVDRNYHQQQRQAGLAHLRSGSISDINRLPSAKFISTIRPQTRIVSLIVAVVTVGEPKHLTTRGGSTQMSLVELCVGDETCGNFCINFWFTRGPSFSSLPCAGEEAILRETDELSQFVQELQPQDVILARNIALGSFDNKIFGQTLRHGKSSLDLLYRSRFKMDLGRACFDAKDLNNSGLLDPRMSKVRRVKDWSLNYIAGRVSCQPGLSEDLVSLPLDTQ